MLTRILFSAAMAVTLTSFSSVGSLAEGLSATSYGYYGKHHKRKHLRHYDRRDYRSDYRLRESITAVGVSNSVVVTNPNTDNERGYVYEPMRWLNDPLNKVSHIVHISDDMVALAESRAQWRAEQGIGEQTKSIIIIAGSEGNDRVSSGAFMPETYAEPVEGGSEVIFYNE